MGAIFAKGKKWNPNPPGKVTITFSWMLIVCVSHGIYLKIDFLKSKQTNLFSRSSS